MAAHRLTGQQTKPEALSVSKAAENPLQIAVSQPHEESLSSHCRCSGVVLENFRRLSSMASGLPVKGPGVKIKRSGTPRLTPESLRRPAAIFDIP